MIKIYPNGTACVEENRAMLATNPYQSMFFSLDAPQIKQSTQQNYAIAAVSGEERLLCMKLSPYSLLLFGDASPAAELFEYLLSNDYEIGSLLGGEALCNQVIAMLESRFGIRYREALAMDFMEAREVTEESCADVEIPNEADLQELVECKTCFVAD